jgi:hypothetical protein
MGLTNSDLEKSLEREGADLIPLKALYEERTRKI